MGGQTQVDEPCGVTVREESQVDAHDSCSDTESINSRSGQSDAGGLQPRAAPREEVVPTIGVQLESFIGSFEWLASVDLQCLFSQRAFLMKSVPGFMKVAYRSAMRIALTQSQCDIMDLSRVELFLMIAAPQTPTGGKIPKAQLHRRIEGFLAWRAGFIVGRWVGEHITQRTSVLPSEAARLWRADERGQRRWFKWENYLQHAGHWKKQRSRERSDAGGFEEQL